MKAFVTGVNGQLGHDIVNELYKRGYSCIGSDIGEAYVKLNGESEQEVEKDDFPMFS